MKGLTLGAVVAALIVVVAACGDDAEITIDAPWARTSPNAVTNGAAYFQLTAAEDDALVGASVDGSIAAMAQVHEVVMDADGAMQMQQTPSVSLPGGEAVLLAPGGYHIMLMDLAVPLQLGQTFEVRLQFEKAAPVVVEVEVMEEAP